MVKTKTVLPGILAILALAFIFFLTKAGSLTEKKHVVTENDYEKVQEIPGGEDLYKLPSESCSSIDDGSICVEYNGTYWITENIMLACEGVGTFENNPCPKPNLGGCRISVDKENEIVTWYYGYGGDPFSEESIVNASSACNAVPGGYWIDSR